MREKMTIYNKYKATSIKNPQRRPEYLIDTLVGMKETKIEQTNQVATQQFIAQTSVSYKIIKAVEHCF